MVQIVKPLKVDLSQESSYIYMKVKQYDDNSRKYQVIFTDRGIPINMTGNELITLHLAESGQEKEYANRDCVWENGYPYITFSSNMLSKVGDIDATFTIFAAADHSLISSRTWHLNVQRSLIDYDGMIESSEFSILNNLIEQALMIPELISKFNASQNEINALIVKINSDIADYQSQFTDMKSQWSETFQEALNAVNNKLAEYQNRFSTMETDWTNTFQNTLDSVNRDISDYQTEYTGLKTDITDWYDAAQQAEESRVSAENKRQENAQKQADLINEKVAESETATENAKTTTKNADDATEEAKKQAALAATEAANARAATEALHYELIDCDGGTASSDPESYANDFNGGGA